MPDNEPFYIDHLGNEFNSDGTRFVRDAMKQDGDTVYFYGGIASNFYHATIWLPDPIYGEVTNWPTNEHYFQASKLKYWEDATRYDLDKIRNCHYPKEAKSIGRLLPLTEDALAIWNFTGALIAMLECNMAKYTSHGECWGWLNGTGDKRLVEHSSDDIWGDGKDGSGRNLLGHTLEIVRAKLK